ncbi:MAG: transposase [Vicinamibacterales bacterium]
MPCRNTVGTANIVFHVINRAVRGTRLFEFPGDYQAFERILAEAAKRFGMRVLAYCVMPNHWHLIVWPDEDYQLSKFMHWLTLTHAMRWNVAHDLRGSGAVYQSRFKSIPVQTNEYFLAVTRYVERNALRANLISQAEDWPWCSLWARCNSRYTIPLHEWPILRPSDWIAHVNAPQTKAELAAIRKAVQKNRPIGATDWQKMTAEILGLEKTLRSPGRPRTS